ncbi:MAG: TolC family protein, partial [Sinobacterium sp.]|nr:TolC family protein [Sinobacterium sp.]
MKKIICACLFFVLAPFLWASDAPNDTRLSLSASITYAFSNDQWLQASYYREQAYIDQATSDSVLPDPTISVGLVNLPTDSFDFDQENMTQFKLAYTQRFPGGDSLDVKSRRSRLSAETMPFMRQDRMASVKREVSLLWLDGYLAAESIRLIKKNYALFEQLAE